MIDAQHYCVKSRGVEDTGSSTVTTRLGGGFKKDPEVRNEFYQIARMGK
jgi:GTP cyclohydrolase I